MPKHAQEYDATLKLLLRKSANVAIRELTGTHIKRWLNTELPRVQNLHLDLLGETTDRQLIHIELQSANDPLMPLRMAEYCLGIYRLYGRFPRQLCVYVGNAPLAMPKRLRAPNVSFRFEVVDIRSIDGRKLLKSRHLSDNVIGIFGCLRDNRKALRRIFDVVSGLPNLQRRDIERQLLVLSGLRGMEDLVIEEAKKNMPITADFTKHKVLGPAYKKGIEKGIEKGQRQILHRLIERRFGKLSRSAETVLKSKTAQELEDLSLRILDAHSLAELLK